MRTRRVLVALTACAAFAAVGSSRAPAVPHPAPAVHNCFQPGKDQRPAVMTRAGAVCVLELARLHTVRTWPDGHVDVYRLVRPLELGRGGPTVRVRRGELLRFRFFHEFDRLQLRYGGHVIELTPGFVVPWRVPASGRFLVTLTVFDDRTTFTGDRYVSESDRVFTIVAAR